MSCVTPLWRSALSERLVSVFVLCVSRCGVVMAFFLWGLINQPFLWLLSLISRDLFAAFCHFKFDCKLFLLFFFTFRVRDLGVLWSDTQLAVYLRRDSKNTNEKKKSMLCLFWEHQSQFIVSAINECNENNWTFSRFLVGNKWTWIF